MSTLDPEALAAFDYLKQATRRGRTPNGASASGHGPDGHAPGDMAGAPSRPVPVIDAGDDDLARTSDAAWSALVAANDPPCWFVFGSDPVRIERTEDGANAFARTLDADRLGYEVARVATWFRSTKNGASKPAAPPARVLRDMLAAPVERIPLPPLVGIVQAPTLAPDGSLDTDPGYHPAARVFYAPAPGFVTKPVPSVPSADEVARARSLIVDDLLGDFAFCELSERANAVALFVDPYVRPMVDGPTPLRLIEAPTPGSGKGLLADVLLRPALGRNVPLMPAANDDDEWRKRLFAQLVRAPAAVVIDNITTALDSGALASVLTSTLWTERRLGTPEMVDLPVRTLWVGTANNPTMTTELARRTVRIRLDPKVDRPWQRRGFRHGDLRGWVDANRAELVWAGLVLARHWVAEGMPKPTASGRLGSFEAWEATLGGILGAAGIDGFLGNLDAFYEQADTEGGTWRELVSLWSERFGTAEVGVSDLFVLAGNVDGFDFGRGSERSQKTGFGLNLNRQRDRVIGGWRVVNTRTRQRVKRWQLMPTQADGPTVADLYAQAGGGDDDCRWRG